jgi:hypothetical protein
MKSEKTTANVDDGGYDMQKQMEASFRNNTQANTIE